MTETDIAATGAGDEPLAWLYNHAKHAPRITPYKQLDHEGWTETALVDAAALAALRQQLAEARAQERERCAKVADDHAESWGLAMGGPAIVIAAAIRALLSPNDRGEA